MLGLLGANACHYEAVDGTTSAAPFLQDDLEAGCFDKSVRRTPTPTPGHRGFWAVLGGLAGGWKVVPGKEGNKSLKRARQVSVGTTSSGDGATTLRVPSTNPTGERLDGAAVTKPT